jgi:hypothetical protein
MIDGGSEDTPTAIHTERALLQDDAVCPVPHSTFTHCALILVGWLCRNRRFARPNIFTHIFLIGLPRDSQNGGFARRLSGGPVSYALLFFTNGSASERAQSIKRLASGLSIRFFNVAITMGRDSAGNLTGNILRGRCWL